jgi:hypothetical protein
VGASGCPATGGDWETAGRDDIPKAAAALPVKNVRLSMAAPFHTIASQAWNIAFRKIVTSSEYLHRL